MTANHPSNADKWRYTLWTTLLFFVVINPMTYKLVQSLVGGLVKISSPTGCPTFAGMFVHGVVFTLLLRKMMDWDL